MDKFNKWLGIVSNLGVIVGIFLLAYEIQTNTAAVRSASYQAFNETSFSWADSEIDNAAVLANIYEKPDWDELTAEERLLLSRILFKAFAVMETNYLHYRSGAMEEDLFEARVTGTITAMGARPLWRQWYEQTNDVLLPEFKVFLDARIKMADSSG